MTITLRVLLVIISILNFIFIIHKIRKSQLEIVDSVIWVLLSILFVFMSVFSSFLGKISRFFGFDSPSNFVFTMILFFLLIIVFAQTVKISILNEKIKNLNHYIALHEKNNLNSFINKKGE